MVQLNQIIIIMVHLVGIIPVFIVNSMTKINDIIKEQLEKFSKKRPLICACDCEDCPRVEALKDFNKSSLKLIFQALIEEAERRKKEDYVMPEWNPLHSRAWNQCLDDQITHNNMETQLKKIIECARESDWKLYLDPSMLPALIKHSSLDEIKSWFMDKNFWQSLGKNQDDWCSGKVSQGDGTCIDCSFPHCKSNWKEYALAFHEINLTDGFESAVLYLSNLLDNK